jgi:regulator of nucleoside diphosphate kinase
MHTHTLRPRITVSEADRRQLLSLAMADSKQWAEAADDLLDELERARVVPEAKLPPDVVRMGSSVSYRAGDGEVRGVTLVYPAEADIAAGRISVLTPVGTALIGLRTGQSITWSTRDGHQRVLTVLSVAQPAVTA